MADETRPGGSSRRILKLVGLAAFLLFAVCTLWVGHVNSEQDKKEAADQAARTKAQEQAKARALASALAEPGIDGPALLGQPRTKARQAIGNPVRTEAQPEVVDWFKKGALELAVTYEKDKAVEVIVIPHAEVGAAGAPAVLRWFKLDPGAASTGSANVAGASYRVTADSSMVTIIDAAYAMAQQQKQEAAQLHDLRKNTAARLEHGFLRQGQDVRVYTRGKDGTTLRIDWLLCNRATLTQLLEGTGEGYWEDMEHAAFQDSLRKAGFKKIECLDPSTGAGVGVGL